MTVFLILFMGALLGIGWFCSFWGWGLWAWGRSGRKRVYRADVEWLVAAVLIITLSALSYGAWRLGMEMVN